MKRAHSPERRPAALALGAAAVLGAAVAGAALAAHARTRPRRAPDGVPDETEGQAGGGEAGALSSERSSPVRAPAPRRRPRGREVRVRDPTYTVTSGRREPSGGEEGASEPAAACARAEDNAAALVPARAADAPDEPTLAQRALALLAERARAPAATAAWRVRVAVLCEEATCVAVAPFAAAAGAAVQQAVLDAALAKLRQYLDLRDFV